MTKISPDLLPPRKGVSRMPRPSQLSPDNILRFLQLKNNPVALEELSRALQVKKSNRGTLLKMLAKLKKRGLVEELSHSRFALRGSNKPVRGSSNEPAATQTQKSPQHPIASRDEIPGRLVLHHDGYGFVVP